MIPRISTGTSFKGAGLYYLHDKRQDGEKERLTTDRVAWTYAVNTLENDPEAALSEMRTTAFDQFYLKMMSGNRIDGRPTDKPVMTVALAWSPEQAPTKEQMIEAGYSYLRHMKADEHETLFVAHNDTKHPHIHIILNTVHPDTGMALDTSWTKTRSHQWALQYERENGAVLCKAREGKYEPDHELNRARPERGEHLERAAWKQWHELSKENAFDAEFRAALREGERDALKQQQRDERMAFWKETSAMRKDVRAAVRAEVREEFKDQWRGYTELRAQRDAEAKRYDREARRAIKHVCRLGGVQNGVTELRQRDDGTTYRVRTGANALQGVRQVKERQAEYHQRIKDELAGIRKEIATQQTARIEALATPALDKLAQDRAAAYEAVKATHREDRAGLRHDQAADVRRFDVLARPEATIPASSQQVTAYVDQAKRTVEQEGRFAAAAGQAATPRQTLAERRESFYSPEAAGARAEKAARDAQESASRAVRPSPPTREPAAMRAGEQMPLPAVAGMAAASPAGAQQRREAHERAQDVGRVTRAPDPRATPGAAPAPAIVPLQFSSGGTVQARFNLHESTSRARDNDAKERPPPDTRGSEITDRKAEVRDAQLGQSDRGTERERHIRQWLRQRAERSRDDGGGRER